MNRKNNVDTICINTYWCVLFLIYLSLFQILFIFIDLSLVITHPQPLYQNTMLNSDLLTQPQYHQAHMPDLHLRKQRFLIFFLSHSIHWIPSGCSTPVCLPLQHIWVPIQFHFRSILTIILSVFFIHPHLSDLIGLFPQVSNEDRQQTQHNEVRNTNCKRYLNSIIHSLWRKELSSEGHCWTFKQKRRFLSQPFMPLLSHPADMCPFSTQE